jgi:uncharacterized protein YcbK (DUF882 family)
MISFGDEAMQKQRRRLVIGGLAGLAGLMQAGRAAASFRAEPSSLSLYHIHTRESLSITYRENGVLIDSALEAINHLLRDFRADETCPIDVTLLDRLVELQATLHNRGHYEVICGYRCPATNAALRRVTSGVAEHSLHMEGRAIDVRLVGTPTDHLRDAAIARADGGVGYYAKSNFVHLDTGAARAW